MRTRTGGKRRKKEKKGRVGMMAAATSRGGEGGSGERTKLRCILPISATRGSRVRRSKVCEVDNVLLLWSPLLGELCLYSHVAPILAAAWVFDRFIWQLHLVVTGYTQCQSVECNELFCSLSSATSPPLTPDTGEGIRDALQLCSIELRRRHSLGSIFVCASCWG